MIGWKRWTRKLWGWMAHGLNVDVVARQSADHPYLGKNMSEVHGIAEVYDNKTEHLYSFLQVMTAAVASFAHGSNDVANAIGPVSTIYLIWREGSFAASMSPVPTWLLAFGGTAIVVGLATYGYKVMSCLGNRLTLHSPSRGFSMELGTAFTVVLASRLALPVSTTQCMVGATVAVGLCNGTLKALNWRMTAWAMLGWMISLPMTGVISGLLMAFVLYAPR